MPQQIAHYDMTICQFNFKYKTKDLADIFVQSNLDFAPDEKALLI
jgi:hypothetical protein